VISKPARFSRICLSRAPSGFVHQHEFGFDQYQARARADTFAADRPKAGRDGAAEKFNPSEHGPARSLLALHVRTCRICADLQAKGECFGNCSICGKKRVVWKNTMPMRVLCGGQCYWNRFFHPADVARGWPFRNPRASSGQVVLAGPRWPEHRTELAFRNRQVKIFYDRIFSPVIAFFCTRFKFSTKTHLLLKYLPKAGPRFMLTFSAPCVTES